MKSFGVVWFEMVQCRETFYIGGQWNQASQFLWQIEPIYVCRLRFIYNVNDGKLMVNLKQYMK